MGYRTVCLAIVFGHIYDGEMWELRDREAVCYRLISLFLSAYLLEKLVLSYGASVVVFERSRNVYNV